MRPSCKHILWTLLLFSSLAHAEGKSHYELLGVSPKASVEEIKAARLKLITQFHPDRNPNNPLAEEMIKNINAAWDILKDPRKRAAYDLEFARSQKPSPQTPRYERPRPTPRPPSVGQELERMIRAAQRSTLSFGLDATAEDLAGKIHTQYGSQAQEVQKAFIRLISDQDIGVLTAKVAALYWIKNYGEAGNTPINELLTRIEELHLALVEQSNELKRSREQWAYSQARVAKAFEFITQLDRTLTLTTKEELSRLRKPENPNWCKSFFKFFSAS